jgi:hypothetical protein
LVAILGQHKLELKLGGWELPNCRNTQRKVKLRQSKQAKMGLVGSENSGKKVKIEISLIIYFLLNFFI